MGQKQRKSVIEENFQTTTWKELKTSDVVSFFIFCLMVLHAVLNYSLPIRPVCHLERTTLSFKKVFFLLGFDDLAFP